MGIICDGCRVLGSWEHRCHGRLAKVNDARAGGPCECPDCSEALTHRRDCACSVCKPSKTHQVGCICETCSADYERQRMF